MDSFLAARSREQEHGSVMNNHSGKGRYLRPVNF